MQIKIGAKVIMDITTDDVKCMDNDLLSSKDWLIEGLKGKINNCKKRMFIQWIPILRSRSLAIPPTDSALIALILSQPDYKNRYDREDAIIGQDVENVCLVSNKKAKSSCPWETTKVKIFSISIKKVNGEIVITRLVPTDDCDVH